MGIRRQLGARAPIDERGLLRAETYGFARDVDRRVAAADDHHTAADRGRTPGLERLDERQRVPDARKVVTGQLDLRVRSHADAEEDRIGRVDERLDRTLSLDRGPEVELDSEASEELGLRGKRVAHLPVRRDRIADETAHFLALVEDGHAIPARSELAGAGETGG